MSAKLSALDKDGWLAPNERKRYRKAVAAAETAAAKLQAAEAAILPVAEARKRANKPPARRRRKSPRGLLASLGL